MSTSTAARVAKGMRLALITGGLVAIAFGIAVLVWPAKTAAAITGIIVFWAIVAGLLRGCQARDTQRQHASERLQPAHQRSNSSRCPCGSPTMRSPSHTSWPLTQVAPIREWKVVPSNGDHAHFDSTSSRRTVNGVSSMSARSAQ